MSFVRNPDNSATFSCNYCGAEMGNSDTVVMFYGKAHFHPNCYLKGVEKMKAEELRGVFQKDFKPVDLATKVES